MKRFLVLVLVGCLTPIATTSTASAAVKAGGACKSFGQISKQKGLQYTCVKSGKKFVWSKGVKIAKSKVTPTPKETITAPTPLTIDNLDFEQVYQKSRAEVAKYVASGVSDAAAVNYLVGANVDAWRVDIAKTEVESAVKLWSSFFKPSKVTIVWYSSKDIAWAKTTYDAAGGYSASPYNGMNSCTARYCGNAGATIGGGGNFLFEQGLEFVDQGLWNRSTAAHEYTHLAQYGLSTSANSNAMPWWSVEGGAVFYGEAIGYTPFDSSKTTRSGMHTQYTSDSKAYISALFPEQSIKSVFLKNDPQAIKVLMKSIETRTDSAGALGLSYLLGSYATEVLVALYGHEKMANFYSSFATSTNYEANFSNVFGITPDTFYGKLAPYLLAMAAELK